MAPRNVTVTSVRLGYLRFKEKVGGGYEASQPYVVTFSDGSQQEDSLHRDFLAGPRKVGMDDLYVDIRALIEAREGVVPD